ncbi:MAG: hypothetical protein ACI9X4_002111 [Glaciecola sp.]
MTPVAASTMCREVALVFLAWFPSGYAFVAQPLPDPRFGPKAPIQRLRPAEARLWGLRRRFLHFERSENLLSKRWLGCCWSGARGDLGRQGGNDPDWIMSAVFPEAPPSCAAKVCRSYLGGLLGAARSLCSPGRTLGSNPALQTCKDPPLTAQRRDTSSWPARKHSQRALAGQVLKRREGHLQAPGGSNEPDGVGGGGNCLQ